VLANSQLVLNILSVNTAALPVNFPPETEIKPLNCLSTLTTIPEAISSEASYNNIHEILSNDNNNTGGSSIQQQQEQSWCIYGSDQANSKSTDALIEEDSGREDEELTIVATASTPLADKRNFPSSISFAIIKEAQQQQQHKSNSNSNASLSRASNEMAATDKPKIMRSRSGSKHGSKNYEPMSSESLTDSQGYMDDFDESCALIANADNGNRRKINSSNDLIMKRNSLSVNKVPQNHRFSAGDADKLEKGIKSLPSTRSLRES